MQEMERWVVRRLICRVRLSTCSPRGWRRPSSPRSSPSRGCGSAFSVSRHVPRQLVCQRDDEGLYSPILEPYLHGQSTGDQTSMLTTTQARTEPTYLDFSRCHIELCAECFARSGTRLRLLLKHVLENLQLFARCALAVLDFVRHVRVERAHVDLRGVHTWPYEMRDTGGVLVQRRVLLQVGGGGMRMCVREGEGV